MAESVFWQDRAKVHLLLEACLSKHTNSAGEFMPSMASPGDSGKTAPKVPSHRHPKLTFPEGSRTFSHVTCSLQVRMSVPSELTFIP